MTAKWYFQSMGVTIGPFTGVELRKRALHGQISTETLIRKDGSERWVTADRVQGLLDPPSDEELDNLLEDNAHTPASGDSAPSPPPLPLSNSYSQASTMPPQTLPEIKEYKILTQKDKWFSGKFDPAKLEEALNAYAEQGWTVKAATTATIPGFGGNREELIVILER